MKTGFGVREARQRCPDIVIGLARPERSEAPHRALMDLIGHCFPRETPASIDAMACARMLIEQPEDAARAIAGQIKAAVRRDHGEAITCTTGIAPNHFLAKTAADKHKPDRLTVQHAADLPQALHGLPPNELCGVGPAMLQRLLAAGIHTTARLCAARPRQFKAIWGGTGGERFRGDLQSVDSLPRRSNTSSIGHAHVAGSGARKAGKTAAGLPPSMTASNCCICAVNCWRRCRAWPAAPTRHWLSGWH